MAENEAAVDTGWLIFPPKGPVGIKITFYDGLVICTEELFDNPYAAADASDIISDLLHTLEARGIAHGVKMVEVYQKVRDE